MTVCVGIVSRDPCRESVRRRSRVLPVAVVVPTGGLRVARAAVDIQNGRGVIGMFVGLRQDVSRVGRRRGIRKARVVVDDRVEGRGGGSLHGGVVAVRGLSGACGGHDLVFTNRDGNPLDRANVRKQFHRLLQTAGLPQIRIHDLRHTAATLLLLQGVNPRTVTGQAQEPRLVTARRTGRHRSLAGYFIRNK